MNPEGTGDGTGDRATPRPPDAALSVDPRRVEQMFAEVMERPAHERASFLHAQCAHEPVMRREVEQLVHHASMSERDFLATPPAPLLDDDEEAMEPGTVVAEKYRIERLLGRGGMGAVYLARQTAPLERDVALKFVRPGLGSRGILSRFEQERRTLARLNHPNIAGVFDAGLIARNQPFFVMEFVGEETLIEYARSNELSLEERINLFIDACAAVQYAHQQGVIHRDLKPSNLLVARRADRAVVKVIDFGIAKVINREFGGGVEFTQTLQPMGTPLYMSPEQASGEASVDTRSDIYGLGAILYELLTGSPPLDRERCCTSAVSEVIRQIREDDPPRPSQRVGTDRSRLRGDLDWIIMKALAKDPDRRYASAWAFARDLQRYLRREPVEAGPPTALYRLRKFAGRHRAGVAAGLTVAAVLPATTVIAISFAIREAEQRQVAEEHAQRAIDEATRAERESRRAMEAETDARQRADELEQVVEFQASQLSDLDTALMGARLRDSIIDRKRDALTSPVFQFDGEEDHDSQIESRLGELEEALVGVNFTDIALEAVEQNILNRALGTIDEHFADQPLVRARLLQTIAATMNALGLITEAMVPQQKSLELYERELGEDSIHALAARSNLAKLLHAQGRLDEAEPLLLEVLEARRRALGDDDPDTLTSINALGLLRHGQGRLPETEALYREALNGRRRVLGDDHPQTLESINNMGGILQARGQLSEAAEHFREVMGTRRRVLGDDHHHTLISINNMGNVLRAQSRYAEAESYYREALEGGRRTLGDEHPSTLVWINNVGAVLALQERYEEAEPFLREAMEIRMRMLGPAHPRTLVSLNDMGYVLKAQGRLSESEQYYRRALKGFRGVLGDNHLYTLTGIRNMGGLLRAQGKHEEAEPYYREALERRRQVLGEEHSHTIASHLDLAQLLIATDRAAEAVELLQSALSAARRADADGQRRLLGDYLLAYGVALTKSSSPHEAEAALIESYDVLERDYGASSTRAAQCASALIDIYEEMALAEPDAGHDLKAEHWRARRAESSVTSGDT